jgi:AraC family transcriptional regulator of adaptative response / DNA-3-methyladenine glycosylase II
MIEQLRFLGPRAIDGIEEADGTAYRRSLALEHGWGIAELRTEAGSEGLAVELEDERDRPEALARCRRLLGLDADTSAIDAALGSDPLLGPLVRRRPGLRVPGCTDGFELAVRAVLGQQVTLQAARNTAARLVALHGRPLAQASGTITHLFPTPAAVARADSRALRLPRTRAGALRALALAVRDGELELDPGADRAAARQALLAIPGIGPWTSSYVAMRALGDPDAFPPGDAGVRRALERLGTDGGPASAASLAQGWRPWRSYAVMHLWRSLAP